MKPLFWNPMKKNWMQARKVSAVLLFASLGACGGGGGASTAPPATGTVPAVVVPPADGLGGDGHLPGTVVIEGASLQFGSLARLRLAVGLSNEGRALAAWQVVGADIKADQTAAWAQSDTSGVWGPARPLPQAANGSALLKLTMRMNAAGNAVLGWGNEGLMGSNIATLPRVTRFIQGSGWDPVSYDPMAGFGHARVSRTGASWDLSLLDDNSFTYSGRTLDTATVVQTMPDGRQKRVLETDPAQSGSVSEFTYFAPRSNGDGLLYTAVHVPSTPLNEISARLASVGFGLLAPIPLGRFEQFCSHPNYESPMVATTTARGEGVLALTTADNGACQLHNLQLIRLYTESAIRVETTRLNSPGTYLPVAPAVVVDKAGNALAVWVESTGDSYHQKNADTVRMMWSQSLYGAAWTAPQPLLAEATENITYLRWDPISLAMNAEGRAVTGISHGVNPMISVRKFDFKAGWTAWKDVANKQDLQSPAVAINASGQVVVAYTGIDQARVNGKAPNPTNGDTRVFVLRF